MNKSKEAMKLKRACIIGVFALIVVVDGGGGGDGGLVWHMLP